MKLATPAVFRMCGCHAGHGLLERWATFAWIRFYECGAVVWTMMCGWRSCATDQLLHRLQFVCVSIQSSRSLRSRLCVSDTD